MPPNKKNPHPHLVINGSTGLVESTSMAIPPAKDIPGIVEEYILLVGKAVAQLSSKSELSSSEINAIAAVGRSVAMLQAVQEAKIHQIGGKPVSQLSTDELRRQLAAKPANLEPEET
jgi:hypothetical protein